MPNLNINKIFLLSFILLSFIKTYAQIDIKGKIIDSENGTAINDVSIINLKNNNSIFSDTFGAFELHETGTYRFTKLGYLQKEISISSTENEYLVIQMNINPSELNEIIVSANHIPQKLIKEVATIDIISSKDIDRGNNLNVQSVLNRVPGIFMQSGSLNTNKISIRGIGSRNLYGTSKIRAYFQDIPLTSGSGETAIEDLELGGISRFEIIKGAASSIYGAGLGGTIHLIPKNAYLNQANAETDFTIGSFGLIKNLLNFNYGTTKNSFRTIYSNTHSDGYRDNNEYDRQTFTINSNHFISNKDDLTFLASYVDLKAYIPSSINEDAYLNNPKSAAFTWANSRGYEDSKRGVFGVSWHHQYNDQVKHVTSVFTSFKDAYEPRPFDILTENTFALGIRSRLLGTTKFFDKNLNWTLGGELFRDTYKYGNFENLYQDYPAGTGSVEGDQFSSFKEKRTYYNIFLETNYSLTESTTISVGLNYNKTKYTLKDEFVTQGDPDQSGSYGFDGILSPKFGVSHVFAKNTSVYTNVSHGFSPPTTAETLLPDGLINTSIRPETGWNFEIGTRASWFENRLQLNLAIYRLDVRNLLVARRTGDDQFIGVNAGKTQHDGVELVVNYKLLDKATFSINSFTSYTLNNFTFKEFIDEDNNYSGNDLTGVPSDIFNTGIDLNTALGIYGNINFQYVGSIPITDNNSLFTDSYNITNAKAGYRLNLNKNLKLNIFLGLNNIFDQKYASQILINASGFGGSAPRYYYPGNPINYFTGINLNYTF